MEAMPKSPMSIKLVKRKAKIHFMLPACACPHADRRVVFFGFMFIAPLFPEKLGVYVNSIVPSDISQIVSGAIFVPGHKKHP